MKIIQPSFELSTPFGPLTEEMGIQMLRFVEKQARISHRSEPAQTEDSWKRFIKAVVLEHGDYSVIEHAYVTATIRVDRGVTHELVRHRTFSYTQESTRFVRYHGNMEFVVPAPAERMDDPVFMELWSKGMNQAEENYTRAISQNWYPQVARSLLPNALAATIAMTGNLRAWRGFFTQRVTKETHPDLRRISVPMLAEFQRLIPLLYDDIEVNVRQIDNLRKAR